jgi:3-oxoacyl-[acyl-carrier protein] reductase
MASALEELGATVLIASRSPCDANALPWDISDPDSSRRLLSELKVRHQSVNMLVHCAHQFSPARLIPQVSPEEFASSLQTNLVPVYALMRGLARGMYRAGFGRVLLLGSLISVFGGAGKIPYIVEKSAFNGLARGFNAEFGKGNVITRVLHPSLVATEGISERVPASLLEDVARGSEGGQLLSVDEVVRASLALLDPGRPDHGDIIVEMTGGATW